MFTAFAEATTNIALLLREPCSYTADGINSTDLAFVSGGYTPCGSDAPWSKVGGTRRGGGAGALGSGDLEGGGLQHLQVVQASQVCTASHVYAS